MEGVTAEDSPRGSPEASDRPIFANDFDRVLTARGRESAARPDQGTNPHLVQANHGDHDGDHDKAYKHAYDGIPETTAPGLGSYFCERVIHRVSPLSLLMEITHSSMGDYLAGLERKSRSQPL